MYIFACASKKWQNNQLIDDGRILVEVEVEVDRPQKALVIFIVHMSWLYFNLHTICNQCLSLLMITVFRGESRISS